MRLQRSLNRRLPIGSRAVAFSRRIGSGLLATSLVAGMVIGVFALASSGVASASTGFTLTMTSGTFIVKNGTPTRLPTPATIKGTVNATTGAISGAALTIPVWHESNTGSTETVSLFEPTKGSGSGSIDSSGTVTYVDTLTLEVHITSPITYHCKASPIHVTLESTAPYNKTTHEVTLKNAASFSIPAFSSSTCSLAASTLDKSFEGSTGNFLILNLRGTVPEPPPPATSTTTTLTATPGSPQVQGTPVTLKATVKKTTGTLASAATGTMKFRSGTTTVLAVVTVSGGSASYTTASLKAGIHKLTAVYSGGGGYAGSTSSVVTYVIGQAPSVTVSGLPATVRPNSATLHPFTVVVTNPSSGGRLTHLFLKVALSGINNLTPFAVVLQYQDTSGTWCNLANFKGVTTVSGYIPEVGVRARQAIPHPFRWRHQER